MSKQIKRIETNMQKPTTTNTMGCRYDTSWVKNGYNKTNRIQDKIKEIKITFFIINSPHKR